MDWWSDDRHFRPNGQAIVPVGTEVRELLVVTINPESPGPARRIFPLEYNVISLLGDPRNNASGRNGRCLIST